MSAWLALPLLLACHPPAPADDATGPGTHDPFARPTDPLAGTGVTSCALYEETTCDAGRARRCEVYDPDAAAFVDAPDPLLQRVLRYDRWYDLYASPDGQTASRDHDVGFAPGAPEAEWADPSHFAGWDGLGDSAIWTGVALDAAMFRWLATGTEADRARFERKVRDLLTMFEVTDVDGYLARYHYIVRPNGSPPDPAHATLPESEAEGGTRMLARDPTAAPDRPAAWEGATVGWQGNPSIDQYTGSMVSLPAAWGLLDDAPLRDRIARQLTCYASRLRRIELRNLQQAPELLDAALIAVNGSLADDPDLDLASLDTVVGFGLISVTPSTYAGTPKDCPGGPPTEAVEIYDATSPDFMVDLLNLGTRIAGFGVDPIDHFYAPSVRGGDAVHLIHLAAMAWHFTGDDAWRAFLEDDVLGAVDAARVANSIGSLIPPAWCRSFYGDHITLPPLWALLNLIDPGPVRDELLRAMREEGWDRTASGLGNAKFDLMIADHLDASDPLRAQLVDEALDLLADLGGYRGALDDPRRACTLTLDDLTAALGAAPALSCPTAAQRSACEDGYSALGLTIPGESITHACAGSPLDCPMGDGTCADAIAAEPLPPSLRRWEDFAWQRNPYAIGGQFFPDCGRMAPGLDLTEPWWLARARGMTGDRSVLAWHDTGACP